MACISLPTAMAIGGGLSAAGGIASGIMGADAARQAAKTQAAAAESAIGTTKDIFGQIQQSLNPFVGVGTSAIPQLQNLLGVGSQGQAGIQAALEATPGYQFTLRQGLQAAQSGFASQGLAESGPAIKGAIQYAEGLAGTTYQQRLDNYFQALSRGQSAATAQGEFGATEAASLGQLLLGKGTAQAGGIIGSTNALTGGITNALGSLGNAALALGLPNAGAFGGPGGGGGSVTLPPVGTLYGPNGGVLGNSLFRTPQL